MGQTRQDNTRTELSRPGEPGLTMRMVEKGIQQQQPAGQFSLDHVTLEITYPYTK